MFSFHSKYFAYRELKRAPQNLSFCFKCPDTGTVQILGNILHLLLAEFSVRTVNYGASFFPSIYGPNAKRAGHKSMETNEDP